MRLEVVDPKKLSLSDILVGADELFCLYYDPATITTGSSLAPGKPKLTSMAHGPLCLLNEDSLLVRIIPGEEQCFDKEEEPVVEEPPKKERRTRELLTYKLNSADPTNNIFVEFRPTTGDIRVNFKDKESAKAYFDYFREQFYTSTTGASVITVSNIYKDLNQVNWNPEDCDDWGWYTLDNGTCRYITDVLKTKNSKMFGFTLKKPTKLYEAKKRDA